MTKEKLEQIQARMEKDYKELIEEYLKKNKTDIINDAYRLAHFNEIVDFFDCIDEEYPPLEEEEIDKILDYQGNAIYNVFDSWLNYGHPERYNFFCYEDLVDIIRYAF